MEIIQLSSGKLYNDFGLKALKAKLLQLQHFSQNNPLFTP